MELTKARSPNGRFPKGFSGSPGGRPRDEQKAAELARSYTREAIETLAEPMQCGNDEKQIRGTAAQMLIDQGWGKSKVKVVSNEVGSNPKQKLKWLRRTQSLSEPKQKQR